MITLSTRNFKAKKIHKCDWCNLQISINEEYERSSCVQDGAFYEWKNHKHCLSLYHKLKMNNFDDGYGVDADTFEYVVTEKFNELNPSDEGVTEWEGMIKFVVTYIKKENTI